MKTKFVIPLAMIVLILPLCTAQLEVPNWRIEDYWEYSGSFSSEMENISIQAQLTNLRLEVASTEISRVNGELLGTFRVPMDGVIIGTITGEMLNPLTNNTLEVDVGFTFSLTGVLYFTTMNLSLVKYDITVNLEINIPPALLEFLETNLLEVLDLFIPEQIIQRATFSPPLSFMDFPVKANENWSFSSNITTSSEIIGENRREEIPPQTSEIYFEAENFKIINNDIYHMTLSYIPFLSDIADLMEIDLGNEWQWSASKGMIEKIQGLQDKNEVLVIGLTDTYFYNPNREKNSPPVANFTYLPPVPIQTQGINFDDSSTDPDGYSDIIAWYWDFGDGKNGTGKGVTHQYESSGDFNVTLFIIDKYGGVDTIQKTITVSDGDGNDSPGFGIILVFLAVSFLIMRKSARKSR